MPYQSVMWRSPRTSDDQIDLGDIEVYCLPPDVPLLNVGVNAVAAVKSIMHEDDSEVVLTVIMSADK